MNIDANFDKAGPLFTMLSQIFFVFLLIKVSLLTDADQFIPRTEFNSYQTIGFTKYSARRRKNGQGDISWLAYAIT